MVSIAAFFLDGETTATRDRPRMLARNRRQERMRCGGIAAFDRQNVRDRRLTFAQSKNRARNPVTLSLPVLPQPQALNDAMPAPI